MWRDRNPRRVCAREPIPASAPRRLPSSPEESPAPGRERRQAASDLPPNASSRDHRQFILLQQIFHLRSTQILGSQVRREFPELGRIGRLAPCRRGVLYLRPQIVEQRNPVPLKRIEHRLELLAFLRRPGSASSEVSPILIRQSRQLPLQRLRLRLPLRFRPARASSGAATLRQQSFRSHRRIRSEEHTSELQSRENLVCRLLLEKKK